MENNVKDCQSNGKAKYVVIYEWIVANDSNNWLM
jgi:hypothetical protein